MAGYHFMIYLLVSSFDMTWSSTHMIDGYHLPVLIAVVSVLGDPLLDAPLLEVAMSYVQDREKFNALASEWTKTYAM